jgi:hypothetical protein
MVRPPPAAEKNGSKSGGRKYILNVTFDLLR